MTGAESDHPRQVSAVLFDLDGTLLDTAPDLVHALNLALADAGRPTLEFDSLRPIVSLGAGAMLEFATGLNPDVAEFTTLRQRFLHLYRDNLTRETRLFPGMEHLLGVLENRSIPWGVVTNKPGWLTDPLLAGLELAERAACVVSGDTIAQRKPDPAPLRLACNIAGARCEDCLFVGDARKDIEAGRNAGMATLVALFGYIMDGEDATQWGATGLVHNPREILDWITARSQRPAAH